VPAGMVWRCGSGTDRVGFRSPSVGASVGMAARRGFLLHFRCVACNFGAFPEHSTTYEALPCETNACTVRKCADVRSVGFALETGRVTDHAAREFPFLARCHRDGVAAIESAVEGEPAAPAGLPWTLAVSTSFTDELKWLKIA
jgi:hypothetical protein